MAPERFRGVSDRRGDLYALGATLYELLTLRPAFKGKDQLELIHQIENEAPVPLRQLDRKIPADLETIVLKSLAKDPDHRFASAEELGAELRRFLEHRPIRSRPISTYERLWRWSKRNPAVAALSALAAVLTVFIAIGSTVAAWTLLGQRNDLRIEQRRTKAAALNARLALGQSLVSEGAALQRTGLIGQRFDGLDRLSKAAQVLSAEPEGRKHLPEIRNHAIAALGLTDLRVRWQREYTGFGTLLHAAGERYVVADRSGPLVCAGWRTTASWSVCRARTSGIAGIPGQP
jgi:hypothetical protein